MFYRRTATLQSTSNFTGALAPAKPGVYSLELKQELLTQVQQGLEVDLAYKWPVAGDALANATHLQTNGAMGAATGGAAGAAPTQPWPATLPEQVKAVAQAQVDLKQERELRKQTDKRMTEMTDQEKARTAQIRDLKDQLQTTAKKNTALTKDLERQSQAAATTAVASKQERGEPESVAVTEKKILAQAKGESATGADETAPDADKAKTSASGAFIPAGSEADRHYMVGVQKWDAGDVDGAIKEFKEAIRRDDSMASAYYNIALGYFKKGDRDEACDYAYEAGEVYLKNKNSKQATRMVVLLKKIDPSSSLIEKLRKQIAKSQK